MLYENCESFEALLSPFDVDTFHKTIAGRQPLFIPGATDAKRTLLPWKALTDALAVEWHWSERLLKIVRSGEVVDGEHYCEDVDTLEGVKRVANMRRVEIFLSMGASLIANEIQAVSPGPRAVANILRDELGAGVGANAYFSFESHQGFSVHYDLSDVLAVHTEGEKIWRIYRSRADTPIAYPEGDPDAIRTAMAQAKGELLLEAHMRPGDVLYIPRGYFHEARAIGGPSLHVTFSIAPPTGLAVLEALRRVAGSDARLRAYVPDARQGPAARDAAFKMIAQGLSDLLRSPAFVTEFERMTSRLTQVAPTYIAPARIALRFYRATGVQGALQKFDNGDVAAVVSGRSYRLGREVSLITWVLGRPLFAVEEAQAAFPHIAGETVASVVEAAVAAGLLKPAAAPS